MSHNTVSFKLSSEASRELSVRRKNRNRIQQKYALKPRAHKLSLVVASNYHAVVLVPERTY
eukprot:6209578-Pleurochrysis_carterae.AAC.1